MCRQPHSGLEELWLVQGADHCQLWDTAREQFEARVLDLIQKALVYRTRMTNLAEN